MVSRLLSDSDQTWIASLCELRLLSKSDPKIRPLLAAEGAIPVDSPNPQPSQNPNFQILQHHNSNRPDAHLFPPLRIVVIDSPLSRRSHLDSLVGLLPDSHERGRVLLIIIECKPRIEYAWQMRFEVRDSTTFLNKWYKNTYRPMDQRFTARDFTYDDIPHIVSKLVVNTTYHVPLEVLFNAFYNLTTDFEGGKADLEEWMGISDFNGVHMEGQRELNKLTIDYCPKGNNHNC